MDFPQAPLIRTLLALTPPGPLCEAPPAPALLHRSWEPIINIARARCSRTARQAKRQNGLAMPYFGLWATREERLASPIYHHPVECQTPRPAEAD